MTKKEKAQNLFLGGYNCAQSVFAAFCEETGLDEKTALRLSSPFGGGMGRMREVCGAFSGMLMVIGLLYGYDETDSYQTKKELYEKVQNTAALFRRESGSIICREILKLPKGANDPTPEKRTKEYYSKRKSCIDTVGLAAQIMEEFIRNNPID